MPNGADGYRKLLARQGGYIGKASKVDGLQMLPGDMVVIEIEGQPDIVAECGTPPRKARKGNRWLAQLVISYLAMALLILWSAQ